MTNITFSTVLARGLLTGEQYAIVMESGSILWTVLSFLGLISNIINIRTFITMGLKDGVTVSFLFLSLFDLSFLMMSFCCGLTTGLSIIEARSNLRFQIEPYGLFMFFGNVSVLLSVTNTLTTTFIAVARCMCVAKPLHFKNTFTRDRTIVFNLGFMTFAAACYTPILANMGMLPSTDHKSNITRPSLWMSKNREAIRVVVWAVVSALLPLLTEVVITFCVFVMISSLRTASRFRQVSTLSSANVITKTEQTGQLENIANSKTSSVDKLSGKDQRVVQQVVLISVVYIACNTPKIILCLLGLAVPQFSARGLYKYMYTSVHYLQKNLEIGNASVNIFIYCSYNKKFRSTLRRWACS